jgi:hypothetical protein
LRQEPVAQGDAPVEGQQQRAKAVEGQHAQQHLPRLAPQVLADEVDGSKNLVDRRHF